MLSTGSSTPKLLCKFKCNNFSKKCRKRKGTKNRAQYIGYICCLVLWHVVFEVKILNYTNVMKHKDHCEIGESKRFFFVITTNLLTFFKIPKGKIFFLLKKRKKNVIAILQS
jgi:hypothetical protein